MESSCRIPPGRAVPAHTTSGSLSRVWLLDQPTHYCDREHCAWIVPQFEEEMMAKARRSWIVTKHGPLQKIEDNLWAVEGKVPGVPIQRRMVIARKGDGSLVFFHAIPLDDKTLEEVRSLGKPAYLVLGHHQHAIDAH